MNPFDKLADKIHKATKVISDLREENQKLQSELSLLRDKTQVNRLIQRENDQYKRDSDHLRTKLEKLNKKLEKVLLSDLTFPKQMNGGHN